MTSSSYSSMYLLIFTSPHGIITPKVSKSTARASDRRRLRSYNRRLQSSWHNSSTGGPSSLREATTAAPIGREHFRTTTWPLDD